jgi:TonB-dependent starch-binding outer membrane protein SusC
MILAPVRSRLNIDAKVNNFINVGANLQFSDRDDSSVPASLEYAKRASPYGSIYEPDGTTIKNYPHDDNISPNPFANYYHQDRLSNVQNLFANIYGEILLPFGFAYKVSFVNRYLWSKNLISFLQLFLMVWLPTEGAQGCCKPIMTGCSITC